MHFIFRYLCYLCYLCELRYMALTVRRLNSRVRDDHGAVYLGGAERELRERREHNFLLVRVLREPAQLGAAAVQPHRQCEDERRRARLTALAAVAGDLLVRRRREEAERYAAP